MYTKKIAGFTIVELMVVVGLIAILLVLALASMGRSKMKARDNVRVADIDMLRIALEEYRADCGVYPETLELSANNGRAGNCQINGVGVTLGDYIPEIPTAPSVENTIFTDVSVNSIFNGYFYAGLSTQVNGPCYDYHIGTALEFAENNDMDASSHLSDDHDFEKNEGQYDSRCGSAPDFGTNNGLNDDKNGLYDFRSQNNQ